MGHETDWFEEQEKRHERCCLRRIVLELLGAVLAAVFIGLTLGGFLYSGKVRAEESKVTFTAKDSAGNIVRITAEPCDGAPPWINLRRAEMRYEGVDYIACWVLISATVIVFDSNGDATPVPISAFEKDDPI